MSQRYQGGFITASYNGLKVPDAPTIGTATKGDTTASVTFTAPADVGGGAITSFTAIANPGGSTATGASSPLTVTGLSNGTAYTLKVLATNIYGSGSLSAASNSVTPAVLAIGDAFGGGYYAGQISTSGGGVATHYLVVADKSVGEALKKWGPVGVATGFTSDINGPANSAGEAALGSTYEAATFCENLNTGGYTDWYLPAANELIVLYYFLKPGTTANNTGTGSNPNAVSPEPISTNFTSGNPAQTTATSFRTGASSQEFAVSGNYWASTEYDQNYARIRDFNTGDVGAQVKGTVSNYARAIRRVAV